MRKVYDFLDALRKIRIKLSNSNQGCQSDWLACHQPPSGEQCSKGTDQHSIEAKKNDKSFSGDEVNLADTMKNALHVSGLPKHRSYMDKELPMVERKVEGETICTTVQEGWAQKEVPPAEQPQLASLWQNIKRVLLICGGQREPLESAGELAKAGVKAALVDVMEAQRFVRDVFAAMEVPPEAASEMADVLIAADYFGHRSMGIHRLPAVAADLLNCTVDARAQPLVLQEREALALVDGRNAPGPVVANYCMDLAVRKARVVGFAWVSARRSNCIGMAGWYACQALTQRMIGICMSNAPPVLVACGGKEPVLGENPIACAAAGADEQFLMDMGMSSFPIEQFELDYCNGRVRNMPTTLALDCNGRPTGRVVEALRAQRLRAFKPEYKGFGLAGMVDILCGVLTGAQYATQLRRRGLFSPENAPANLGQVYVAIDPLQFCASFEDRLRDFHQLLRRDLPCDQRQMPLVPGDKEIASMQQVDNQGGLEFSNCTLCVLKELAERFKIKPLRLKTSE
ncbi:uncharacterized protein LOC115624167 [Scaptodrosophila lebanonensis]|uniref:Uncharacterized protein LOC115624167 n=1 Tax=Drosophila lebanonensis TaxID=7225 RepID=A0A6J2TF52_DROLE|nr:uncharacterized protein LOC115624167 [Scaptodrosophila lebanonensis]